MMDVLKKLIGYILFFVVFIYVIRYEIKTGKLNTPQTKREKFFSNLVTIGTIVSIAFIIFSIVRGFIK